MNVLGIDLGGTNVRCGLVRDGLLAGVASKTLPPNGSQEEILDLIYAVISSFGQTQIDGIGIGVPSVVDVERGIVYDVVNIPSWKEVPLKDLLRTRFQVPVFVNNDANCFAAGEKFFGKGKSSRNMVGLILGTGLGAGLVLNDRLYAGRNCGAGEFGMIPYLDGVLENYCSGQFFKRFYQRPGEELFGEAVKGDARARDAFHEFGKHVGDAVAIILLAVDPDMIILGGSASKAFPLFRDAMRSSLSSFPYPRTVENVRIEVSEVDKIALLGAAALFFDANGATPSAI